MTDKEIAAKCAELCGLKFVCVDYEDGWSGNFNPASSLIDCQCVVDSVRKRGLEHPFTVLLSIGVMGPTGWNIWRDTWAIIDATPRQKCLAAIAAWEVSKK